MKSKVPFFSQIIVFIFFMISFVPQSKSDQLRGINIALHNSPSYEDLKKVRSWGANSIRLVVFANPQHHNNDGLISQNSGTITFNEPNFLKLDSVINNASKVGLAVVIDLHSWPNKRSELFWLNELYQQPFIKLWEYISQRYSQNSTVVAYDLMNEPNILNHLKNKDKHYKKMMLGNWSVDDAPILSQSYINLMQQTINVIRKNDSKKIIIIEGYGFYGHVNNFNWLVPLKGNNLTYSFHFYEPKPFVNQGQYNVKKLVYKRIGINYPSEHYNKQVLLNTLTPIINFQKKYNANIYVGEFGVSKYTDSYGGDEWIKDTTDIFAEYKWGWSYWSYSTKLRNPELMPSGSNDPSKRLEALKKAFSAQSD